MELKKVEQQDRDKTNAFITKEVGGTLLVLREGEQFELANAEGFVIYDKEEIIGLITYEIRDKVCEILSLDSKVEGKGIGTQLVDVVKNVARNNNCSKLLVETTNALIRAIAFYQRKGFRLVKIYPDAMKYVREVHPYLTEADFMEESGIVSRDLLEFEMEL
jgi:N-acetylglutamate synthase and related acetyltransferases